FFTSLHLHIIGLTDVYYHMIAKSASQYISAVLCKLHSFSGERDDGFISKIHLKSHWVNFSAPQNSTPWSRRYSEEFVIPCKRKITPGVAVFGDAGRDDFCEKPL
ncbi:MAG: hypothetical protein RR336_01695, partial [Oscillospiraceae bacterium]